MSTSSTSPVNGSASATPITSVSDDSNFSFESKIDKKLEEEIFDRELKKLKLEEIRNIMESAASEAGEKIKAADPSVDESETKNNSSDRVTETDKAAEELIKTRLSQAYPHFDFLGEESHKEGQKLSDRPTFVVDPIDGTLNFIHGVPNVAVSIALTLHNKPVIGVVYNPFRDDMYTSIKYEGSYLSRNGGKKDKLPLKKPVAIQNLQDCLVAVEWGNQREGPNWDIRTSVAMKLLSSKATGGAMAHSMRCNGSAALDLCYVADGSLDAFWEGGCWIWDVCAGWLIVEEAGGLMAGANPGEWTPTLEGRSYFAVRAAPSGREEVVEEVWALMEGKCFAYPKAKK